jgi:hypothetical protein
MASLTAADSQQSLATAATSSTATSLSRMPRTSKELMLYNYRMGFFNLAANFAVLHKTKHLEVAVTKGRKKVNELNEIVNKQEKNLNELSEGIEKVSEAVDQQQVQVDETLNMFRKQVAKQNEKIKIQQLAMQKLVASKFQTDAVVDSSIAAISGLLIRTPFVTLPVYLCTALLPKRSQWFASLVLKFIAFFQVALSMRKIAIGKGVHNAVGTPSSYVVAAITFIRIRTKELMAKRRHNQSTTVGSEVKGGGSEEVEGKEEGKSQVIVDDQMV